MVIIAQSVHQILKAWPALLPPLLLLVHILLVSIFSEWEAAAKNVPASTRSVIIRTGIVLARDGGVLARMLPIFELFAGDHKYSPLPIVFRLCTPTAVIHI